MKIILHADGLPKQTVSVNDLNDASAKFSFFRDANNLGASDLLGKCGDVMEGKKLVATVSYNGRVWGLDGKEAI